MPCVQLTDRAILRLSGTDARPFLQDLLTQDMALLADSQPLYAGLLSAQGKALFQLFLFADGADVLLDVVAAQLPALQQRLLMFRLRRAVEIAAEPELKVWQQWQVTSAHPADPRLPEAGQRFVAAADAATATATLADWHAHRLALGLPDADEIGTDDLLWLESNARELNGVSFTKGCYPGQENTARMHHRDRLRKRLLPLRVPQAFAIGSKVYVNGRNIGELRGQAHAGLQMALLRMTDVNANLMVADTPVQPLLPPWLPRAAAD